MTCWVLLRGLTREARHWGNLPQRLALGLGGVPIVAHDLPGNGVRHRDRSPVSIEATVGACRDGLMSTGHPSPYVLVGMSLGAMVAMSWASSHTSEVCGLVLINSSTGRKSAWFRRLRWRSIPALLRIVATRDPTARERLVMRLTSCEHRDDGGLIADWAAWRREYPVSMSNACRQLLAAARYRGPETSILTPVLVLSSAGDALCDPACSSALATTLGASLRVHPTAGHDLPLDDSAWVAEQAITWWRTARPQAQTDSSECARTRASSLR